MAFVAQLERLSSLVTPLPFTMIINGKSGDDCGQSR